MKNTILLILVLLSLKSFAKSPDRDTSVPFSTIPILYTSNYDSARIIGVMPLGNGHWANNTFWNIDLKKDRAPINSPVFTGVPMKGSDTIATLKDVRTLGGSNYSLPIASGTGLGGIKVGPGLSIDGSGVLSAIGNYAPINSPVFTGTPQWNSDTLATKAYVRSVGGTGGTGMSNPMITQYDLIVGGVGGTPVRQAPGSNGQYLGMRSGALGYYAIQASDVPVLNQNTTGTASNIVGVLGANSFPAQTGDVNNIQGSLSTTVVGIKGVSIPSLSVGNLRYNGSAFVFDNAAYQTQLSGTGFVKVSGSTVTYDNNTYVPNTTTVNGKALSSNVSLSLASTDFVNQGTATTVLHGNAAGAPSFSAVSLSGDVIGVLPVANGGNGTNTPSLVAGSNISISGTWPNYTISASGFSSPMSAQYDLIVGGVGGTPTRQAVGLNGQYLGVRSGVLGYYALQASDVPTLNQNTTGSAGSVANALSQGYGVTTFSYNGSAAKTVVVDTTKIIPYTDTLKQGGMATQWYVTQQIAASGNGALPSPSGHIGQFITTADGTTYSWGGLGTTNALKSYLNAFGQFVALNTDSIGVEGSTNKWWTNARTLSSTLTGYSTGTAGSLSASNTVFTAFQTLDANVQLKAPIANPNFTGVPTLNGTDTLATQAYVRANAGTGGAGGSSYTGGSANTNALFWNVIAGTYQPRNIAASDVPDLSATYAVLTKSSGSTGNNFTYTQTAASGVAYGTKISSTLNASNTGDVLDAFYITGTFPNGSYTSIKKNFLSIKDQFVVDSAYDVKMPNTAYISLDGGSTKNISNPSGAMTIQAGTAGTFDVDNNSGNNKLIHMASDGTMTVNWWNTTGGTTVSAGSAFEVKGYANGTFSAANARGAIPYPVVTNGHMATLATTIGTAYGVGIYDYSDEQLEIYNKSAALWTKIRGTARVAVADANYTVSAPGDLFIAFTSLTATRSVNIGTGGAYNNDIYIKDEAGTAATNNITLTGPTTIDGIAIASIKISTNGGYLHLYTDGAGTYHLLDSK